MNRLISLMMPVLMAGLLVSGCSLFGGRDSGPTYESASRGALLEVPPDLAPPRADEAYILPEDRGVTAREIAERDRQGSGKPVRHGGDDAVLPEYLDVRMERDGSVQWLVVRATPGQLWGRLKAFVEAQGLTIKRQDPRKGIIETDWAKRRLGVSSGIRRMFETAGGFLAGLKDSGLRDKFVIRLHDDGDGQTAVFITHRGAEEIPQESTTVWVSRPSDPALEGEMLADLMIFLGERPLAGQAGDAPEVAVQSRAPLARLVDDRDGIALRIDDELPRVWRRLGVLLDRSGLIVDDMNREQGIYYVTFLGKEQKRGFFSRIFGDAGGPLTFEERYQVRVREEGGAVYVTLHDKEGRRLDTRGARKALEIIRDQY